MPLPASSIPALPLENEPVDAVHESPEMLALLARRRSTKVGRLGEPSPSDAQIDALLGLAARVPDHGKLGPWRFVVIAGEARERAGEALARVIAGDDGVDASRLAQARGLFLRLHRRRRNGNNTYRRRRRAIPCCSPRMRWDTGGAG